MLFCRFTRACTHQLWYLCASCLGANETFFYCVDRNKSNTFVCSSYHEANERNLDGDDSDPIPVVTGSISEVAITSIADYAGEYTCTATTSTFVPTRKFQFFVGGMSVMLSIQI